MKRSQLICSVMLFAILASVSGAQVVGRASINAPAVLDNNTGNLTQFNLTVTVGTGVVAITGPQVVGNDTIQSAQTAAQYASTYLHLDEKHYNFTYHIGDGTENVSGPSAGAAMTMLAISALDGKPFSSHDFTMTGTISPNGTIGLVGGVYDKSGAASSAHYRYILVPRAQPGSFYSELYVLIQDNFDIPVIQVSNISQAMPFVFGSAPIAGNLSTFTFYNNFNVHALQNATLTCSNQCDSAPFAALTNNTFNITAAQISDFSFDRNFTNATSQFVQMLNESRQIAAKGYLYTAADIAFLEYANAFLFANNQTSIQGGYALLNGINGYCSDLIEPQQTTSNYEYLIQGRMRQLWGEYTANQTISLYNSSVETTDDVLAALSKGAEAEGWCSAADKSFSLSSQLGGFPSTFNSSDLQSVAYQRLTRAKQADGNSMYTITAQQAYNGKDYAVSIIDSDYAYSQAEAAAFAATASVGQLLNASAELAQNSTYGAWATQFANEALFYSQESRMVNNATAEMDYAVSAYSSAYLASQISNDTMVIAQSQVAAQPSQSSQSSQQNATQLNALANKLYVISLMELVVGIGIFGILVGMLMVYIRNHHRHMEQHRLMEEKMQGMPKRRQRNA